MSLSAAFIFLSAAVTVFGLPQPRLQARENSHNFVLVSRSEWNARPPTIVVRLETPVEFVVIHHTYQPGACHSTEQCSQAMRGMQNYHQESNGWGDIGYNFAVGGDGKAYEGRGWNAVGAHTYGFNIKSIGIVLIGDWRFEIPPAKQLEVVHKLIAVGVEMGIIRPDYKLIGHRQAGSTECPGEALFNEISKWDHFQREV
ncbi:peptidoglycan-recognition protein LB-like [Melitaea cinxia]|uniref:peptidoglycan-recognition protein LB-like n=1 Tax=Melitaea cinxia TaxID=113334 RepID=UPI001E2720FF|nr:peptidoglycan-recognition protein LB-like [Melitaea cinxia]